MAKKNVRAALQGHSSQGGQAQSVIGKGQRFGEGWDSAGVTELWRDLLGRTPGEDWDRAISSLTQLVGYYGELIGGILTQLIADAEDRLGKSEECVEWYQREAEECRHRISQLRSLAESLPDLQELADDELT